MVLSNRWAEFETHEEEVSAPIRQNTIDVIPLLEYQLCDKAQSEYWKWCGRLKEIGALNDLMVHEVTQFAVALHDLEGKIAKGQSVRYPQDKIDKFLKRMRGIYEQHQPASSTRSKADAYSHFGFAKRARQRRHG